MRTEYSDEIMNFSNWKISLNFTPHSGTCSFWVNTIEIKMSTKVSSYIWLPPTRCRLFFLKQGRYVWLGTIRFVGLRLCIFLSFLPSSKLNLQNNSQWPSQPQSCHLGCYGSTYFLIGPEKSPVWQLWVLYAQLSPMFSKFTAGHLSFTKDLHSYLFSLIERYLKRIFAFVKKDENQK